MGRKILLAAGGTVAVTGVVLGGIAVGLFVQEEELARARKQTEAGTHSINAASYKNVAFWALTGGAVAGGATLLYHFLSAPSKAPVQATGFVGPQGGGVLVQGQF